jgi:hypothetical protein
LCSAVSNIVESLFITLPSSALWCKSCKPLSCYPGSIPEGKELVIGLLRQPV